MTIIEVHTMEIIKSNLPKIANELKRIADSLEVVACGEIPSRICIGGKTFNVAYTPQKTKKEKDNDNS